MPRKKKPCVDRVRGMFAHHGTEISNPGRRARDGCRASRYTSSVPVTEPSGRVRLGPPETRRAGAGTTGQTTTT